MDFKVKLMLVLMGAFFTLSGGLIGAFEIFRKSEAGEKWIHRMSQQSFLLMTFAAEVKISSAVPELREAFHKVALIGLMFLFLGAIVKFPPILFVGGLTFVAFGIASFSLEIVSRPKSVIKSYFVILAFSTAAILTFLLGGLDQETNLIPKSLPQSAILFGIMNPATNTEIFYVTVVLSLIFAVGMFLSLVMLAVVGGVMVAALVMVSKISAFLLAKVTKNILIYCIAGLLLVGTVFAAIYPVLDLLTQQQ